MSNYKRWLNQAWKEAEGGFRNERGLELEIMVNLVAANKFFKTQKLNLNFTLQDLMPNFQQSVSLKFTKFIQYHFTLKPTQKSQKLADLFMFLQLHKTLVTLLVIQYSQNFILYFHQFIDYYRILLPD